MRNQGLWSFKSQNINYQINASKRLPKPFAQVKAGNTSENLLNEIRQIINTLYRVKEITKKVYNNIMNSIKLQNGYYIYEFWE